MISSAKAVEFANGIDLYFLHFKDFSGEVSLHTLIDIE